MSLTIVHVCYKTDKNLNFYKEIFLTKAFTLPITDKQFEELCATPAVEKEVLKQITALGQKCEWDFLSYFNI